MGWNGSDRDQVKGQRSEVKQRNGKVHSSTSTSTFNYKALAAGLIVVALGGAAVWWFCGGRGATRPDDGRDRARSATSIAVSDQIATAKVEKVNVTKRKFKGAPDDWDKPYPPQAYWPNGKLKEHSRYVKVITNKVRKANMPIEERTFDNYVDQEIASLINMDGSGILVGDGPKVSKTFASEFLKSLEKPIVIDEQNDTPAQIELKKAVIDTKKELKARHDAGEDITALVQNTYNEYRELSLYKRELEEQVTKIRMEKSEKGEQFSDDDMRELIGAANRMLAERGCSPLSSTKMFERKMRFKENKLRNKKGQ